MKTTLYIQNLKHGGCESTIINKLSALKGISNISIKLQYATITFEHETKEVGENIKQMLSKIGYPPFGENNSLSEKTKSHVNCTISKLKKQKQKKSIKQETRKVLD